MKNKTCPDVPELKAKILANPTRIESGNAKETKKHRDAAAKKMAEILQ